MAVVSSLAEETLLLREAATVGDRGWRLVGTGTDVVL